MRTMRTMVLSVGGGVCLVLQRFVISLTDLR